MLSIPLLQQPVMLQKALSLALSTVSQQKKVGRHCRELNNVQVHSAELTLLRAIRCNLHNVPFSPIRQEQPEYVGTRASKQNFSQSCSAECTSVCVQWVYIYSIDFWGCISLIGLPLCSIGLDNSNICTYLELSALKRADFVIGRADSELMLQQTCIANWGRSFLNILYDEQRMFYMKEIYIDIELSDGL